LQQLSASACENSAANFHLMVESRMIQNLHDGNYRASFRIVCPVDKALDPGMHQRSGAHCARFNCNKELTVGQTMVAEGRAGFAQRYDLGMGGGVAIADVAIPPTSYDLFSAHYNCTHGHLTCFQRALGAAQRFFHEKFIYQKLIVLGRGCFPRFLREMFAGNRNSL
jgi:hypothetical protein